MRLIVLKIKPCEKYQLTLSSAKIAISYKDDISIKIKPYKQLY